MTRNVLAVSGGGIFGLIPALVLAEIEARVAKPCHEIFDLMSGTSTGGIIACGLSAGVSASQMAELYRVHGAEIFASSIEHEVANLDGLTGPKYSAAPLEARLQATLGAKTLADSLVHLLIPTSRCGDNSGAMWFTSWDGPNFPLWQVARATSAAPYYFPVAEIAAIDGEQMTCADGGLFANNPEDFAALSAMDLWPADDIFVLSLGTGDAPLSVQAKPDWGAADWIPDVIELGIACSEAATLQRALAMGYPRIRLDTPITGAMDDASAGNLATMIAAAQRIIASSEFEAALNRLGA